jgi:hypothetical protein
MTSGFFEKIGLIHSTIEPGEDPSNIMFLPSVARGYVDIASILIHIFVWTRITLYKKMTEKNGHGSLASNKFLKKVTSEELSNIATNFFAILLFASGAFLMYFIHFKSSLGEQKSLPDQWFVYNSHLVYPSLGSACVVSLYYARNRRLRQTIFTKIKENLNPSFILVRQ